MIIAKHVGRTRQLQPTMQPLATPIQSTLETTSDALVIRHLGSDEDDGVHSVTIVISSHHHIITSWHMSNNKRNCNGNNGNGN